MNKKLFFVLTLLMCGTSARAAIVPTGKTCAANSTSTNPLPCTWSSTPSIGENIHCWVGNFHLLSDTFSMADNATPPNTYTANGAKFAGGLSPVSLYQFFDSVNIANSPTITTFTTSAAFNFFGCFSTTGEDTTSPADGPVGTQSNGSGTTLTIPIVPVQTTDIAFCGAVVVTGTITAGTGYTAITFTQVNTLGEYKILSASGAQSATFTTPSGASDGMCATYKALVAAATVTRHRVTSGQ